MIFKKYIGDTNKGPYLENNEDEFSVDVNKKLFMVLDGFGGLNIGDEAAKNIKADINHYYDNFFADENMTMPFFFSPQYLIEGNALINACILAHNNLLKKNSEKELSKRGGSSAIIGAVAGSVLIVVSIGNCSGYLLRNGKMESLAKKESFRHFSSSFNISKEIEVPMNAFGLFERFSFQCHETRILNDDQVIFGSDGAFCGMGENQILSLYNGPKEQSLTEKIKKNFYLANQNGNMDNQTLLAIEF